MAGLTWYNPAMTEIEELNLRRDGYFGMLEKIERQIEQAKASARAFNDQLQQADRDIRNARFVEGIKVFDRFDWKTLLEHSYETSDRHVLLRHAMQTCNPGFESYFGGTVWGATDQYVVHVVVYRDDPQQVNNASTFIEKILPFILECPPPKSGNYGYGKTYKTGCKRLKLRGHDGHDLTLWFNPTSSVWTLTSDSSYSERDIESFMTSQEAVEYFAKNYGEKPTSYLREKDED